MKWPIVKLEQIASVKGGKRLPKGHDFSYSPTEHLYIRARDIRHNRIIISDPVYITDHTFNKLKNYTVSKDDIVVTIVGANIGDVGYISADSDGANLTENAARLRVNPTICNPIFLSAQLSTAGSKMIFQAIAAGSAQGKLGLYKIKLFDVVLPPLQDQGRMVSILSTYDNLIENNRRRIELLEQAARLLYREWFVHFRFPGHELVNIVDGVPEGWEVVNVPDIIDINPKEHIEKNTEIRYVAMSSLSETGMSVNFDEVEIREKSTSVKFRNQDTLFARITPCLENGKTAYVNFLKEDEVACGSTEFIVLRGLRVSPYYVYCLSRTHEFRGNAIKSMIGSSGRQRVQTSCFSEFRLGLPPTPLMKHFEELVSSCFSQIANLQLQNSQLQQARDLLLPRLMNGEVSV